jgi:hypothetical protein
MYIAESNVFTFAVIWWFGKCAYSAKGPCLISTSAEVQKIRALFPHVQQLQEESHPGENTI